MVPQWITSWCLSKIKILVIIYIFVIVSVIIGNCFSKSSNYIKKNKREKIKAGKYIEKKIEEYYKNASVKMHICIPSTHLDNTS